LAISPDVPDETRGEEVKAYLVLHLERTSFGLTPDHIH